MKVALTGGIACGKSLLSQFLNELGVETLDADDVVHELLPDPEERRRIAAEVFADPEKRRALEAKLHPVVKEKIDTWLSLSPPGSGAQPQFSNSDPSAPLGARFARLGSLQIASPACAAVTRLCAEKKGIKIAIIPLLFEAHWEKNFDIICCVASTRERQVERMVATRGMTLAEAEARLAAQMPVEEKAKRSHYVIHNDGTAEELKVQAAAFLKFVMQKQMQQKLPND